MPSMKLDLMHKKHFVSFFEHHQFMYQEVEKGIIKGMDYLF